VPPVPPTLDEQLSAELARLADEGRRRRMRPVDGAQAAEVTVDGVRAINFSSNNYLGLADHPALEAGASRAASRVGSGAGASRLIVGSLAPHRELERAIATATGFPAALLFASGYQANVGLVSALARAGDVVFSDELNHASLIDGCRLSRARVEVYHHNDLDDLAARLERIQAPRRLIASDTIFSMDGDIADVVGLRELADRHGAALVLDEAHAFGVLGPRGQGAARLRQVTPDVMMATFSKALGGFGAFVAGSTILVDYLVNRSRGFIFSTAPAPTTVGAAAAALELVTGAEGDARREALAGHVERFRSGLAELGLLQPGAGRSPIFPIMVGDDARVMRASDALLQHGIFAQGIRPPTVPAGTARLRFSLMATHTAEHIDRALTALAALVRVGDLPRS
jgi:8-amino-7-oxononanoate synthase